MNAPHDARGHSHAHPHSHAHDPETDRLAETAFIEGFRAASDKRAFLDLTHIPQEIVREGVALKLMRVAIRDSYEVGTASLAFGGAGMVYHPLPGAMIREIRELRFIYMATGQPVEQSLAELHMER